MIKIIYYTYSGDSMICNRCKRKLVNNSKYCPRCGYLFPSCDVEKYSYGVNEELIGYYVKDKRIISIFGFSPYYFLFSFVYAFLKKQYKIGIYSFICDFLIIYLIINGMGIVFNSIGFYFLAVFFLLMLSIFTHFYYSFKFNDLYIENIIYRIGRIEKKYYKDDEKIRSACIEDSKNNYIFAALSFILFIVILLSFIV